ncbi:MAG: 5'-nucleotidase C-terminal domain-containing protein, partial [Candidatus Sericytochromatia bacterium]|nr:5'-nucleotidase C-terminal domain-containing protein [Candidatus Tanganyikabacteria bacterium]
QDGTITQYANNLLPIDKTVAADPAVESAVAPYKAKLDPIVKETIGVANGDFKRYNSRDLESTLNNLIADATLAAARKHNPQVEFALVSSGTPRNNVSAGPITVEKVFFALPFDNKIVNVTVTGDVAREMLRIQRRPGENKRHAISANAAYTLIPAPNGKQDIRDITIDGKAFDKNRTYTIAVTDYMSDGGAGFAMLPGQPRQDTGIIQRYALLTHIKAAGTLAPQTGRIQIKSR